MSENNGWPGKPGVPLNPERDGAHRLRHADSGLERDSLWLCGGTWVDSDGDFSIPHAAAFYTYLGPCLTPAERDALKAEKVNLRDDLASVERERAHQHGRADRNAAEYAREQKKREQLQAENARLREVLKDLLTPQTPASFAQAMVRARAALGETQ